MLKKKSKYNVAIMGATGAVGEELISILQERKFPIAELRLLASARSVGKKYKFNGREIAVQELKENSFEGVDIVLASAGGSISKKFAPLAVQAGAVVVDNTSAYRMDPNVPLVVPEVNPGDIKKHKGIIANPNCSTIIMNVPVYPIYKKYGVKRILVSTYQAASGAGAKAMEELKVQAKDYLEGRTVKKEIFPHQIAFNLFSHNSAIKEEGYNEEEIKMTKETHKIFHDKKLRVAATCVRVPILRAHSETIYLELASKPDLAGIRKLLAKSPGVRIVDDATKNYFPMPLEASGQDDVLVGRIRNDISHPKGLCLFVSGDQIRKGAATNAVQIAEILIK